MCGGVILHYEGCDVSISGFGSLQRCVLDCFSKLNLQQQSNADETSQSSVTKQYIRCVFSSQNASVTAKAEASFSGVSDGQVGMVTRPSVMIRNNKQPLQGYSGKSLLVAKRGGPQSKCLLIDCP